MARGTHGRQGPPKDPNALRRGRPGDTGADGWVTLPADGWDGEIPEWPLADPLVREVELWEREWRRPQAQEWARNGQELEVAMYVRTLVAAESPKATAAERTLVVRQQEYLGLSVPGLVRNKWRIGGSEPAQVQRPAVGGRRSARDRLKVVNGGA